MLVLVSNLGSTSYKYKLYDMPSERVLAEGGADRIGLGKSAWTLSVTVDGAAPKKAEGVTDLADHGAAIDLHLAELTRLGAIPGMKAIQAVGYKAVHGGPISGAVVVDEHVLGVMEQFSDVAPQHNPPYISAMRAIQTRLPGVPQVAAFETAFHQTIPLARAVYGIPHEWVTKLGIRRYGFHGASHRYIATRMAQIAPECKKIISAHLGGSCSITAIQDGKSVANSFGMTAQSGVFHASRVGDFDAFALLKLLAPETGLTLKDIWQKLGKEGGLKGLSGVSSDMREVEEAAAKGNAQAQLALDAFVESCRHYVGAYLAVLGGADALVFTGGIGQYGKPVRAAICKGMEYAGIVIDAEKNQNAKGSAETRIDGAGSKVQVWVLPTNEELIVARQTMDALGKQGK